MSARFDQGIVSQVQQANDIVELISEHVSLTKKGSEMVGLCPFHDDHRPSMYVNSAKQIFKCFACGAGGDVFKFVQMRENLTFPQAIERLARRAGIKIARRSDSGRLKQKDVDPNELAKVNAWAAEHFEKNLYDRQKGQTARDYIAQRKITPASVKKWRIGLAGSSGNDLILAAKAKGISQQMLGKAGLVVGKNGTGSYDKFVNRLMFPITDATGRIIGFGGRILDGKGAKYVNSPTTVLFDKSNSLYGLEHARYQIVSASTAIVVEGYTDCIMAHQLGCGNVAATLGTSFTAGHGRILRRYAKEVVLIFDSDAAGIEAANRALEVCLSQHIDIKLASVPQGNDPCDFLLAAGRERFEQLVRDAVDVFEFKWNRLTQGLDRDNTFAGRKSAIEEFLQTVAVSLRSGSLTAIEKGLIVNRLSKIIGLDAKEINRELGGRLIRVRRNAGYNRQKQRIEKADMGQGLFAAAQREILEVLLNEPRLFENVKQKITAELFDVPVLRKMASILFEMLNSEPRADLAAVLAKAESVELGGCFVELAQAGEEKGNFEARLTGALEVMQRILRQREKIQIKDVKDQSRFLRWVGEGSAKENPHNVGMV